MLCYHTEYCFGRRGRICHSYSGVKAFIAILVMMGLGLVFGVVSLAVMLVAFVLRLAWSILVAAMTLVVAILSAPFLAARWVAEQSRTRRIPLKPAWVPLDEVA